MKQLDKITGVLLMAVSVFFYTKTGNLKKDSGVYAKALLILLFVLGLLLLIDSIRKSHRFSKAELVEALGNIKWGRTIFTIVFSAIYVITMSYVGFIPGSLIYMAVLMLVLGVRKPFLIATIPIGTTAILYVVFVKLLSIRLPDGLLHGIL